MQVTKLASRSGWIGIAKRNYWHREADLISQRLAARFKRNDKIGLGVMGLSQAIHFIKLFG